MKKYIIAFCIMMLASFGTSVILFMINVPQTPASLLENTKIYENISSEEYKFEETKQIYTGEKIKQHNFNEDELSNFENNNQYSLGNSNPFTPSSDISNSIDNSTSSNTDDNTSNSNDGVNNSSSNKK